MAEGGGDHGIPAALVDVVLADGVVVIHVALVEELGGSEDAGVLVDFPVSYSFFGWLEEVPFAKDVQIGTYG